MVEVEDNDELSLSDSIGSAVFPVDLNKNKASGRLWLEKGSSLKPSVTVKYSLVR